MEQWIGASPAVFVMLTVVLMGGVAFMTGQALAATWRPVWQVFLYCVLLGCADRFLDFALFQGALLSPARFVVDTAVIIAVAYAAFRLTTARKMVTQYPWLYERRGPFSWRDRADRAG